MTYEEMTIAEMNERFDTLTADELEHYYECMAIANNSSEG